LEGSLRRKSEGGTDGVKILDDFLDDFFEEGFSFRSGKSSRTEGLRRGAKNTARRRRPGRIIERETLSPRQHLKRG